MELFQTPLSEAPIKKISDKEQLPFIQIVDKIIAITSSDNYLDNNSKKLRIKDLEKQVDSLVYSLYALTPEEIQEVETL